MTVPFEKGFLIMMADFEEKVICFTDFCINKKNSKNENFDIILVQTVAENIVSKKTRFKFLFYENS